MGIHNNNNNNNNNDNTSPIYRDITKEKIKRNNTNLNEVTFYTSTTACKDYVVSVHMRQYYTLLFMRNNVEILNSRDFL